MTAMSIHCGLSACVSLSGSRRLKKILSIFMTAAQRRGEALDHVLLHGPPGLGKTSLSLIIANEMGAALRATSGPAIERPGDWWRF